MCVYVYINICIYSAWHAFMHMYACHMPQKENINRFVHESFICKMHTVTLRLTDMVIVCMCTYVCM